MLLSPHPGLIVPEQRPEVIILQKISSPHALEDAGFPPLLKATMDRAWDSETAGYLFPFAADVQYV